MRNFRVTFSGTFICGGSDSRIISILDTDYGIRLDKYMKEAINLLAVGELLKINKVVVFRKEDSK